MRVNDDTTILEMPWR